MRSWRHHGPMGAGNPGLPRTARGVSQAQFPESASSGRLTPPATHLPALRACVQGLGRRARRRRTEIILEKLKNRLDSWSVRWYNIIWWRGRSARTVRRPGGHGCGGPQAPEEDGETRKCRDKEKTQRGLAGACCPGPPKGGGRRRRCNTSGNLQCMLKGRQAAPIRSRPFQGCAQLRSRRAELGPNRAEPGPKRSDLFRFVPFRAVP